MLREDFASRDKELSHYTHSLPAIFYTHQRIKHIRICVRTHNKCAPGFSAMPYLRVDAGHSARDDHRSSVACGLWVSLITQSWRFVRCFLECLRSPVSCRLVILRNGENRRDVTNRSGEKWWEETNRCEKMIKRCEEGRRREQKRCESQNVRMWRDYRRLRWEEMKQMWREDIKREMFEKCWEARQANKWCKKQKKDEKKEKWKQIKAVLSFYQWLILY